MTTEIDHRTRIYAAIFGLISIFVVGRYSGANFIASRRGSLDTKDQRASNGPCGPSVRQPKSQLVLGPRIDSNVAVVQVLSGFVSIEISCRNRLTPLRDLK